MMETGQLGPGSATTGDLRADGRPPKTLVIGCGALAREMIEIIRLNVWQHMSVTCLPASWHNTPQHIPEGVRRKIRAGRSEGYERILVAYGDCGTGGLLDAVLEEEGAERIAGDHCYAFFRGIEAFAEDFDRDPTAFYLTDYLARHFNRLIVEGLKLDRHPELLPDFFGHYSKVTYLAQTDDPELDRLARAAAERLGLAYERVDTGYGDLSRFLSA